MALIEASGIDVHHGATHAVYGVSMSLDAGEIVTIVGPNGSGKSTLLRALVGAVPIDTGTITRAPGLRIGYVPQKLHVDPTLPLSVRRFLNLPKRVSWAKAQAALARTGVEHLATRPLAGLSGGQFQRVLLARAILNDPQVLVLDEPTQGLDQPASAAFYKLIEALRDELGCGVVMVSHELHVVMSATDRVICLNGHICCEGTPDVVTAAPAYRELFGTGTGGALALYRHDHDHSHHGHDHDHSHSHEPAE
ncbi:ATP-binding cassette domain-containing protein [Pseudooctadecabacter sp.]|uniref:ATP-binding cassette domain-containing protein n=1 Tax=Pseudooctadecabacter sp. TaxID=1966338 RepID=UPI0035C85772